MDPRWPTQDEFNEFYDSLSRSGVVDEIRVLVSSVNDSLSLAVTYRFGDRDTYDGRPFVLSFTATPALLQGIEAAQCSVTDAEEGSGASRSSLAVFVEPDAFANWTGASVTAHLTWPPPDADRADLFFCVPEQLPVVLTGMRAESETFALPHFVLEIDESARHCFAAGSVSGDMWPSEDTPMQMLHALLVGPMTMLVREPTPEENGRSRHGIAWTSDVIASSTEAQRAVFARATLAVLGVVEKVFDTPVTVRLLAASEHERQKIVESGMPNVVKFEALSDESGVSEFRSFYDQMLVFSGIWWGSGIRLAGVRGPLVRLAVANCTLFRIRQAIAEAPIDPDSLIPRDRLRFGALAVSAMTFASALFATIRDRPEKKEAFRELTRSWWGRSVPDGEFVAWCVSQGVDVPADALASGQTRLP